MGIVSTETILTHPPFVENVDDELKKLKKEKQESIENYAGAFGGVGIDAEPAAKE